MMPNRFLDVGPGGNSWMLIGQVLRNRRLLAQACCILTLCCGLLAFRAWATASAGVALVRYGGYWLTLVLVLFLLYRTFRSFPVSCWRTLLTKVKAHRAGFMVAILVGLLWQVHEPRQFKVLFDEHGYAGIAQGMHLNREAAYPSRAHYFDGEQHVLNYGVDKRAVLFPFIVSLAHDATGFRKANVFYVNAALGFLSLLLTYCLLAMISDRRIALCGQLMWAGLPMLPQIATGGGYDLLNICLLSGWLILAIKYLDGTSKGGEILFIGVTVALAQVRNESVLYLLGAALLIWWKWLRAGRAELSWQSVFFLPFLIMPVAANVLFSRLEGMLETAPGQDFFSLIYAPENLASAVAFVFNPDLDGMNSALLGYVGVFCLFLFLVGYVKEGFARRGLHCGVDKVVFVFSGMVFCSFIIYMCTFWGAWTDPAVSRFSLPIWLLLLVVSARVASMALQGRSMPAWAPMFFAVWAFSTSIPASANAEATRIAVTSSERLFLEKKLEDTVPGEVLLIVASPIMSVMDGHSATSVASVNAAPWKVQAAIDLKIYKEIWVAERYFYSYSSETWQLEAKHAMVSGFAQETLYSTRLVNGAEFRISKIVGWKDPDAATKKISEAFTPRPTTRLDYFRRLVPLLP